MALNRTIFMPSGLPDPLACSVECHCDLELMRLDEADFFESERTFCKELILLSSMLQFIGLFETSHSKGS